MAALMTLIVGLGVVVWMTADLLDGRFFRAAVVGMLFFCPLTTMTVCAAMVTASAGMIFHACQDRDEEID